MISDYLFGAECGLDVYEQPSEDIFADCATKRARVVAYTVGPIIVLVLILIAIFVDVSALVSVFLVIGAIAVLAGLIFYAESMAGYIARVQHQRHTKTVQSFIDNGMNKKEALEAAMENYRNEASNQARVHAARSMQRGVGFNATRLFF